MSHQQILLTEDRNMTISNVPTAQDQQEESPYSQRKCFAIKFIHPHIHTQTSQSDAHAFHHHLPCKQSMRSYVEGMLANVQDDYAHDLCIRNFLQMTVNNLHYYRAEKIY